MNFDTFKQHRAQSIDPYRHYGIIIPLVNIDHKWHLLYEKRALKLKRQPGEICFPGGKLEPGETAIAAAIRECCEELGISKSQIEIIGPMDYLLTPFHDQLTPFVAILHIDHPSDLAINHHEVAEVFYVPLEHFIAHPPQRHTLDLSYRARADFPYQLIDRNEDYDWRVGTYDVLFYRYNHYVIWGMTAKLTHHLLLRLSDTKNQTSYVAIDPT